MRCVHKDTYNRVLKSNSGAVRNRKVPGCLFLVLFFVSSYCRSFSDFFANHADFCVILFFAVFLVLAVLSLLAFY